MFVVTGRKEDVNKAKREILSAADHFSLIRASRKPVSDSQNNGMVGSTTSSGGGAVPRMSGPLVCLDRLPYRYVYLIG